MIGVSVSLSWTDRTQVETHSELQPPVDDREQDQRPVPSSDAEPSRL